MVEESKGLPRDRFRVGTEPPPSPRLRSTRVLHVPSSTLAHIHWLEVCRTTYAGRFAGFCAMFLSTAPATSGIDEKDTAVPLWLPILEMVVASFVPAQCAGVWIVVREQGSSRYAPPTPHRRYWVFLRECVLLELKLEVHSPHQHRSSTRMITSNDPRTTLPGHHPQLAQLPFGASDDLRASAIPASGRPSLHYPPCWDYSRSPMRADTFPDASRWLSCAHIHERIRTGCSSHPESSSSSYCLWHVITLAPDTGSESYPPRWLPACHGPTPHLPLHSCESFVLVSAHIDPLDDEDAQEAPAPSSHLSRGSTALEPRLVFAVEAVCDVPTLLLAPFVPRIRPTLRSQRRGWCGVVFGRLQNRSLSLTKRLWTTHQYQVVPAAAPLVGALRGVWSSTSPSSLSIYDVAAVMWLAKTSWLPTILQQGLLGLFVSCLSPLSHAHFRRRTSYAAGSFLQGARPLELLETSTSRFEESSSITCAMAFGHTIPLPEDLQQDPAQLRSSTSSRGRVACPDFAWHVTSPRRLCSAPLDDGSAAR
ncbi:hypothetical protein HMN09_01403800 [Mycena chlorophos]|uniref:Uncharacterized protein n=1 Tax=Mycena chlorophos TaxID=658473 RepID=A0A8H6RXS8_MYCCL|nr:hypothetical protein HMN09_01403800 [Mycena chlorophos]